MTVIEALENRVAELEAKNTLQEQQLEQYEQAYATLKHQFQQSLRHRFGSRSERFIDPDHPQAGLFDAALANESTDNQDEENLPDNVVTIASYQRKKKGRGKLNPNLPRSTVIINVPEEQHICPCGCKKVFMRYITTERYDYRPEECSVVEEKREVLVCPKKACRPSIIAAPKPLHIAPKIQATHEFLAHIIIGKLLDRQPLYHLAKKLQTRHGVELSRETLSSWFIKTALPLQPIWNLLKDQYLTYDIAPFDATTLQVLKEPGRLATTKSYVYCFRGGSPDKPVILFDYNATDHAQYVLDWFIDYQGYSLTDADPWFKGLSTVDTLTEVNCNSHARRKFEPIAKAVGENGVARTMMRYYRKLYAIERQAKENKLTFEQRYQLRLEKSKPILGKMKVYLDEVYPGCMPNSELYNAVRYTLTHWTKLTAFLLDGRLEIDNNLTEQEIKYLVMARKNFLFADTISGAHALCLHLSIIRTAIVNGLDPYQYLLELFNQLPYCKTVEDYEHLLPWNIKMIPVQAVDQNLSRNVVNC